MTELHKVRVHLKVLVDEVPSFAQTLHDGFIPQDVLLAQMLSPLPGLQHQAVHRVEISQEVSHALLELEQTDQSTPLSPYRRFPYTQVKKDKRRRGQKTKQLYLISAPCLCLLVLTPGPSPEGVIPAAYLIYFPAFPACCCR